MVKNKKRFLINVLTILFVFFCIQLYIDNNVIDFSEITFIDSEIPDNFNNKKILHISDLHNKSYGDGNEVLFDKINEISPDYIFLTGDMVSSRDKNFSNFYSLVEKIGKKYKCYYVLGNHELDLKYTYISEIYDTLKRYGITVLDNESVVIKENGQQIRIYGMWYNPRFYIQEDFLDSHMLKIMDSAEDGFNILLTHNPDDFDIYSNWGADLTFSGHVHGGMIRLPFIGGLISPNRALFPLYTDGLYKGEKGDMIVSKGLSRGQTGIRIFNKPELVIVTLKNR